MYMHVYIYRYITCNVPVQVLSNYFMRSFAEPPPLPLVCWKRSEAVIYDT